jgi:hypothetical protein
MTTQLTRLIRLAGVFALVALLPLPALAQLPASQASSTRHEGFGIGVKGGPLFSSLSVEDVDDLFETQTGFIGGLFMGGNRPGILGVGVDLLYARRGANIEGIDDRITMDYINVPVYMRINAGSSSLSGAIVYGTVGLDLNFLLKSKLGGEDLTDDFQRADYGLAVGVGVEITRFLVEARYTQGIGNIAKDKDDPVTKAKTFAVMAGFRFN